MILSVDSGHYSSLAWEAIHIRKQKRALNRDVGQLNPVYNVLLSKKDERRRNNARGMKEEETMSKRDERRNNEKEGRKKKKQ